jgi:3-hydroxybutyryl-CoA dehydrogenase
MTVAVVGFGIMGGGIAQVAATAGHDVQGFDVAIESLERTRQAVDDSLARFERAGTITASDHASILDRVHLTTDLSEAVASAEVVIEAAPEELAVKHQLLGRVASIVAPTTLIGSNTSQLSITRVGSALGGGGHRLIGMHFFNPPVMMKLVELVCGLNTSEDTLARARAFAEGLGKEVVVCRQDSPGFITTRAYAVLRLECLRMLEEGLANAEDIDRALRLAFNLPMGPFKLGDFNGLDTYLQALTSLCDAYGKRFRPTVGLRAMVAGGRLGRKTGQGFYRYDTQGRRVDPIA